MAHLKINEQVSSSAQLTNAEGGDDLSSFMEEHTERHDQEIRTSLFRLLHRLHQQKLILQ